jgi:hypothetical protein
VRLAEVLIGAGHIELLGKCPTQADVPGIEPVVISGDGVRDEITIRPGHGLTGCYVDLRRRKREILHINGDGVLALGPRWHTLCQEKDGKRNPESPYAGGQADTAEKTHGANSTVSAMPRVKL